MLAENLDGFLPLFRIANGREDEERTVETDIVIGLGLDQIHHGRDVFLGSGPVPFERFILGIFVFRFPVGFQEFLLSRLRLFDDRFVFFGSCGSFAFLASSLGLS